jgi:hypothetical protein
MISNDKHIIALSGANPEKVLDWFIKQQTNVNTQNLNKNQNIQNTLTISKNTTKKPKGKKDSSNNLTISKQNSQVFSQMFKQNKNVRNNLLKIHPLEILNNNNGELTQLYALKNLSKDTYNLLNNIEIKRKSCRMMIEHIFYSNVRTGIYIERMLQIIKNLKLNLKSYYDTKKTTGQKIVYFDSLRFFVKRYNEMSLVRECKDRTIRRTPALPINNEFIEGATNIIIQQWKILCLTPWGLENSSTLGSSFLSHILAILNYLGKGGGGQRFGNNNKDFIEIIPESKYANKYWPPNTDFIYYGLDKNMITIGTNHLTYAYNSIKKAKLQIPTKFLSLTIL